MPLQSNSAILLLFLAGVSVLGAIAGVLLPGVTTLSRVLIPFSGMLLMLTGIFWILPEVAAGFGWPAALLLVAVALVLLALIDRYVYPVCPSCAPGHNHGACATRLHGFAGPTLLAVALHNFFDGWMVSFGEAGLHHSVSAGVVLHRIPECLATGVILRAALRSRRLAMLGAVLVQMTMFLGAALQSLTGTWLDTSGVSVLLAVSAATFAYLGFHSLHGEWKRRSASVVHERAL